MDTYAIEAVGLAKHFGDTRAVDGLDLSVPTGAVYGVLGPNGAGKTTAIRVLATLLQPTAGRARVLGHDVVTEAEQVRSWVSLTGQFASVDEDLTGAENLVLLVGLWGYSRAAAGQRAEQLLDAFGLAEAGGRQVTTYSGGMRRRLDIAASIVGTPQLVFLDEPTTGLAPRSRNQVWAIIRAPVADGTTVLLTTQYLDEVFLTLTGHPAGSDDTGTTPGGPEVRPRAPPPTPPPVPTVTSSHPMRSAAYWPPAPAPRGRHVPRRPGCCGGARCARSSTSRSNCSTSPCSRSSSC